MRRLLFAVPSTELFVRWARSPKPRRARTRSGAVTLEAILGIPILIITTFAIFMFGMIMMVQQGVTHAAIEAAREAAKVPSTVNATNTVEDAAVATASKVLSIYGLTASGATPTAQVIVEDSTGSAWCGTTIVSAPCGTITPPAYRDCPTTTVGATDTTRVRVRVLVRFSAVPIPDLLGTFGVSFSGRHFDVQSDALR